MLDKIPKDNKREFYNHILIYLPLGLCFAVFFLNNPYFF
jgi:hypothetical protein